MTRLALSPRRAVGVCAFVCALAAVPLVGQPLAGTAPLTDQGDLAAKMVADIDGFLLRAADPSVADREQHWNRDYSSADAYETSVAANRERFRKIIGVVDARVPFDGFTLIGTTNQESLIASTDRYSVRTIRWPALPGVHGEGLLLEPKTPARGNVIALPDADQSPEAAVGLSPGVAPKAQFARRLAESGYRVIIPVLIDRADNWSGHPRVRYTNQPHREFIYRIAYEMGRHIIGYEVQKVLGAVDGFKRESPDLPVGVAGYGEGGLLAFYSAAADTRLDAALVSGYFGPREQLWQEPIYHNVWGLLTEFGDAELAGLVAPRHLVVEASRAPELDGPPPATPQRRGAAPGRIVTPSLDQVSAEVNRASEVFAKLGVGDRLRLVKSDQGRGQPGSEAALSAFVGGLGGDAVSGSGLSGAGNAPQDRRRVFDAAVRLRRQFDELVEFSQQVVRQSEFTRREFWSHADHSSADAWDRSLDHYRDYFWNEVMGRLPDPTEPLAARSRKSYETDKWTGYEVVLPVWPDVFAYGILLVPKDLKPGERRPVVVTQHGLEGRPQMLVDKNITGPYHHYGARLADRGFIVFAPQNPYIGRDDFRVLQRKGNPLKRSLFSFILGQHQRILEWLSTLPFVDEDRIGFYGLSYGGKTAVRVPPLLKQYALSICSADFDEWVLKNTSVTHKYSYIFTIEYEMFEFDLGNTFNYGDLGNMMAPRPFMVERGHDDGVAPDEWVAYEFAKVRRHFVKLGLGDRTEIEYFDGPHEINGVGTFDFLHRHLNWPAP